MKTLSWVTNDLRGERSQDGSVVELLRALRSCFVGEFLPPRLPMNDFLSKGRVYRDGDSRELWSVWWSPITLSEPEYEEVSCAVIESGALLRSMLGEPPEWVQSFKDWSMFAAAQITHPGVCLETWRKLEQAQRELWAAFNQARRTNDIESFIRLYAEWQRGDAAIREFLQIYERADQ